jgi:signal transduction histidine kinase
VKPWGRLRPSVRVRLATLLAAIFLLFGSALLGISYALVSSNLTVDPRQVADALETQRGIDLGERTRRPRRSQAAYDDYREIQEQLAADDLEELTLQYLLILVVMTVLSGGLGWFVAGRALRPTAEITATARRVSQESLHERIALEGPDDELKQLADTFDSMLGRLEAAFERQAAFVANASHELRTPLAVIRTETDVTLADESTDPDAMRRALTVVRQAGARSERLIDALLDLARADRADRPRSVIDLADLIQERLDELDLSGLRVRGRLASARTIGDRELISTMIRNLIDNAVHHNVAGGWISVLTGTDGERAFLEISNSGAQLTQDQAATLVEAFRRLGAARTGAGLGLGLSIAQSIARAHGSELLLEPLGGGGLRLRVVLRRAPHESASKEPAKPIVDDGTPSRQTSPSHMS